MIIKTFYRTRNDGVNLYRIYSDKHHYILQQPTNIKYSEAIDVETAPYTYVETDEVIQDEKNINE